MHLWVSRSVLPMAMHCPRLYEQTRAGEASLATAPQLTAYLARVRTEDTIHICPDDNVG